VHSGSRKMYERIRVGLNCGKDGIAAGGGCKTLPARRGWKDEMAVYQQPGSPAMLAADHHASYLPDVDS
jgi:hypothetical protein